MSNTSAWQPPRPRARLPTIWLAAAAALTVAAWIAIELGAGRPIHPRYAEMMAAARTMQAASSVLYAERKARGILAEQESDPNRTGMIGAEYTPITTSLGDLASKRTTTNPDFAAALVREMDRLDLPRGTPVVLILSGSFVGGNIAAIAAAEALGLRPILVASLSASMWGANQPEFNWLDMAMLLRQRGVIRARVQAAVLGGDSAIGRNMDPAGVAALRDAAARDGVPVVEARPLKALMDALIGHVNTALGGAESGAVINVGGSLIGLGSCPESYDITPGLTAGLVACGSGTPGLIMRLSGEGMPTLHVLNIKRLAVEWGLPFDPVPLPTPGNNNAVYGSGRRIAG